MDRLSKYIRSLRICGELELCSMGEVGIRIYPTTSSPIAIAIKRV
jgi:hypothetical protein